jgi:hypothetical protein
MELRAGTTIFSVTGGVMPDGTCVFALVDKDEGRSITNNAEAVIAELYSWFGPLFDGAVVVYRDTQGIWDELLICDNQFHDFKAIGAATNKEAIIKALEGRNIGVSD